MMCTCTSTGLHQGKEGNLLIYLLYLSEQFNISNLKDRCYRYQPKTTLEKIMVIKSLKLLSKESKVAIYKSYLKKQFVDSHHSCRCIRVQQDLERKHRHSSSFKSSELNEKCTFCTNLSLINMIHDFTDDPYSLPLKKHSTYKSLSSRIFFFLLFVFFFVILWKVLCSRPSCHSHSHVYSIHHERSYVDYLKYILC